MENSNIFQMVTRDFREIYECIDKRLKSNKGYVEAESKMNKIFSENKEIALDLDSIITAMETESKEEAYNQGFADAFKLMQIITK